MREIPDVTPLAVSPRGSHAAKRGVVELSDQPRVSSEYQWRATVEVRDGSSRPTSQGASEHSSLTRLRRSTAAEHPFSRKGALPGAAARFFVLVEASVSGIRAETLAGRPEQVPQVAQVRRSEARRKRKSCRSNLGHGRVLLAKTLGRDARLGTRAPRPRCWASGRSVSRRGRSRRALCWGGGGRGRVVVRGRRRSPPEG